MAAVGAAAAVVASGDGDEIAEVVPDIVESEVGFSNTDLIELVGVPNEFELKGSPIHIRL